MNAVIEPPPAGGTHMSEVTDLCREKALFLESWSLGPSLSLFLILPCVAVPLTLWMTSLADPKLSSEIVTVPLPQDRTSMRESSRPPITPPPAYATQTDGGGQHDHPSTYADVLWSTSPTQRISPEEDAKKFVKGTAILVVVVFCELLLALAIQNMAYCGEMMPNVFIDVLWAIYGGTTIFVLRSPGAWLVLLRNLWGKSGRERFNIDDTIFTKLALAPLMLLWFGAVTGVVACQTRFCGPREVDDGDVELGVTPSSARFPPAARDESRTNVEATKEQAAETEFDGTTVPESQGLLSSQEDRSL